MSVLGLKGPGSYTRRHLSAADGRIGLAVCQHIQEHVAFIFENLRISDIALFIDRDFKLLATFNLRLVETAFPIQPVTLQKLDKRAARACFGIALGGLGLDVLGGQLGRETFPLDLGRLALLGCKLGRRVARARGRDALVHARECGVQLVVVHLTIPIFVDLVIQDVEVVGGRRKSESREGLAELLARDEMLIVHVEDGELLEELFDVDLVSEDGTQLRDDRHVLLRLEQDVVVRRTLANGREGTLVTDRLTLDNGERIVHTDAPVRLTDQFSVTEAVGMKAWIDDRILELRSQVESVYEPDKPTQE